MNDIAQIEENATTIFIPKVEEGFPAPNMNLRLRKSKDKRFGGFGIYLITYNHPANGPRVIYLGSFAGKKSDVSKGDVRTERWSKHIGTANLLLKNLTILSEKNYRNQKKRACEFYNDDDKFKEICKSSFLGIEENLLEKYVFRDRMNISWNRLGFAIQNLLETNKSIPHTLESVTNILSRFHFNYWKIIPKVSIKKDEINDKLKKIEKKLIEHYMKKLPMNNEFLGNDDNESSFFHYDPEKLILKGTNEFENLCAEIKYSLENLDMFTKIRD